jgi:hypothetical protein
MCSPGPPQHKVAGGSPAASVFLLFGQMKVTKENATLQNRPLRDSLRYSKRWAPAELARAKNARTQTVLVCCIRWGFL